uniref:Signal transducer and activator of transcription n=1 Tax=Cynoglossus semilaevis TaxID=244447 RepID=A0A3P8UYP4_CYNSE
MSQWERVMQLPAAYQQQLHELYDNDDLPMDVRHYLSVWMENQEWPRAAREHDLAVVLLQVLLENLDIQHSRFVQRDAMLLKHNIRRYKQNFQRYLEDPCALASTILWFLGKEKEILQSAELAEQVQHLCVEPQIMETNSQQDLERKMACLRSDVQCMEHTMICLEEQQDEFDFKYQTHKMEAVVDEAVNRAQIQMLQVLVNRLNECRKNTLLDINKLLDKAMDLINILVKKELMEWQRRQQKSCIGSPGDVSLDHLEKWFTCVALCLFQVREFLSKLDELVEKVSYENDPIRAQKPVLQKRTDSLLEELLKSSFVVENQPSMPQGKGPLVLRTNIQFCVKTRLLVTFPELNHVMKVNVSMERETPPIKGYRRFNVLGTDTKALNMVESQSRGMVADFRHLTLKEQKSGSGGKAMSDISLSVTEELHIINFHTRFELKGFSVNLQASSLPVVIISNSSQQQSAWASVLWFNMLSQDPKVSKASDSSLKFNALLFSAQSNAPDTFWVWFDGILVMVKSFLEDLWREGLIMGFVSRGKEKTLLKRKKRGTFLLRFSESVIGGITFSWVDTTSSGEPDVKTVQPFTKVDLNQIPFQEIIRNFQILEAENIPENPLLYLYPDTPKDEAFGKFYTEKTGADSPYIMYIKTKLMFVSKENTLEPMPSMSCDMGQGDGPEPVNGLCEEAAEQNDNLHHLNSSLDTCLLDPMMSVTALQEDLMLCPSSPNILDELFGSDTQMPDFNIQELILMTQ